MMTDDEIIAVVQAHKEGKKIEVMSKINSPLVEQGWIKCEGTILWNFYANIYRVVPEPRKPREWWIHIPTSLSSGEKVHIYSSESKGHGVEGGVVWDGECVRVREVIE